MTRASLPLAIGFALAGPASAANAAGPAQTIEPNSPWTLDGGEERCTLLRNFGSADRQVQFQINSFGRADRLLVTLVGSLVPRSMNLRGEARYGFDADAAPRESLPTTQGRTNDLQYVQFEPVFRPYEPSPNRSKLELEETFAKAAQTKSSDVDFERRVRTLKVDFGRSTAIELAVGSMAQPLSALRECVSQLHGHWGLDPAQQKDLMRYPIPNPSSVGEIMANYPEIMASEGVNAYIPVRVMVAASGQPSHCGPQLPDVEGDFTTEICGGLMKRFEPALDRAGNPVASFYQVHVLYTMD